MKATAKFFLIIAFLLAPVLADAYGEVYYVTQKGSGARNGSSLANAWSVADFNTSTNWSSTEDANKIDPGDTVYFSGTITNQAIVQGSGSSGNYITLDGYEAGDCDPINSECTSSAVFDFNAGVDDTPKSTGIRIYGPDYITIQDMRFKDIHGGMRVRDNGSGDISSYVTIKRCYFNETHSHAIDIDYGAVTGSHGTSYITIGGSATDGNYIHNCGYVSSWPADDPGTFSMFASQDFIISYNKFHNETGQSWVSANHLEVGGTRSRPLANGLVEYNDISGAGYQAGMAMKEHGGNNIIVRFNKFRDGQGLGVSAESTGLSINGTSDEHSGGPPGPDNKMHHIYVYGNLIENNELGLIFHKGANTCWVFSNLIVNNHQKGLVAIKTDAGISFGLTIFNNTFVENGLGADSSNDSAIYIGGINQPISTFRNNLFYKNRDNVPSSNFHQVKVLSGDITDVDFDYSQYYQDENTDVYYEGGTMRKSADLANGWSQEYHGAWGDSGLTDPSNGDFTIFSSGAAVVDSGTTVGTGNIATVSVQGTDYHVQWGIALDPNSTDWSTHPPTVSVVQQDDFGSWEKGAYVYRNGSGITLSPPSNLGIVH